MISPQEFGMGNMGLIKEGTLAEACMFLLLFVFILLLHKKRTNHSLWQVQVESVS